jgi:ferredoxin--NADP+ reductase
VAKIVEDRDAVRAGTPSLPDAEGIVTWLAERAPDAVTWEGWQAIDAAECAAGEAQGARA